MRQQYDQLAGEVSDLVAQAGDVEREKLLSVSEAYSSAVGEINERLRRATALVHKGLRDEAIQECEREPNLLDSFELLDIRDQEPWLSMHRILKVPIPPPLLVQQASELNSAYAVQVPLAELLRKHRLLALGHAPLALRIMVLRQISEKDPNSEIWHTDIKAYETERIAEIKSEVTKIRQSEDLAAIQSLYRELNNDAWIIPIPSDIKTRTTEILHHFEIASARNKLDACSEKLLDAFSQLDSGRGFELRDEWELYLGPATLPPEANVLAETQPALDWLEEQETQQRREEERLTLLYQLETLLDDDASAKHELESTYARLSSAETNIPNILTRRYRNRVQSLQLRENRAQTLKIVAVLGSLAVVAGAISSGLRSYQFNSKVRAAAKNLGVHDQARSWKEGLSLVAVTESTAPKVFASTAFQDAKRSFDENFQSDKVRESEFHRLVEAIRLGGVTIEDAPEISALKKLAVTSEERMLHADLDSQKDRHDAEKEAGDRENFGNVVRQIDEDFRSTSKPNPEQLRVLLGRLEQARQDHPYALRGRNNSNRIPEVDETLESRIEQKLQAAERDRRVAELIASIEANVGKSMPLFAQRLTELQQALADSEPGRQLAATLKEQQSWLSMDSIESAVSLIANRAHATTIKQAQAAIEKLKTVGEEHGGDLPKKFQPLRTHLVAVAGRKESIQLAKVVPVPIRDAKLPHAELVKGLMQRYQTIVREPSEWESQFRGILSMLISDKTADPLLRLKLLRVALSKSVEGSLACKIAFQPLLKQVQSEQAETLLRAGDSETVADFIDQLALQTALRKHAKTVKALGAIPKSITWVGWLSPSGYGDGQQAGVQCDVRGEIPDGDLFVLNDRAG